MDIFVAPYPILTQFECGSQVRDFPLFAGQYTERKPLDSSEYTGLSSPVTFHRKGWLGWQPLELPEMFEYAAQRFLREFHTPQNMSFDCYSFACLAAGLPLHHKGDMLAFWEVERVRVPFIIGRKIIFLVDENRQRFGHAALHIGNNYYLSVQGAGGSLSVSKLRHLRRQYRRSHPDILVARPKREMLASR